MIHNCRARLTSGTPTEQPLKPGDHDSPRGSSKPPSRSFAERCVLDDSAKPAAESALRPQSPRAPVWKTPSSISTSCSGNASLVVPTCRPTIAVGRQPAVVTRGAPDCGPVR